MSDYQWWKNAINGNVGPIHEGQPQLGFYKKRKFNPDGEWIAPIKRPFEPVAIWRDENGKMVGTVNGQPVKDVDDLWLWSAKNPIPETEYRYYETHGEWPKKDKK